MILIYYQLLSLYFKLQLILFKIKHLKSLYFHIFKDLSRIYSILTYSFRVVQAVFSFLYA